MIMWSRWAQVCGRSIAGTAGSYPAAGMDVRVQFAVGRADSALCDELITGPEESCRFCVCV